MSEKTDNYCQLLGIDPFNEAKYTPEVIGQKIEKMREKWSNEFRNKQNDTGQRYKNHKLVELVPDIEATMGDAASRKKVFAEGRKLLEGKCQRLRMDCIVLADGSYIVLPGTIDNYVKRLHWDGIDKKLVLKLANAREGSVPKPVSEKVSNAYISLSTVDSYTPSEMLNMLISNKDLEIKCNPLTDASSLTQLRTAFNLCENRVNSVRQDILPDQDSYIIVIRSIKLIIDSDREITDLITYGQCNKALQPVTDMIEREYSGQQISRKYIDELLNMYVRDLDTDMCIAILEAFCHKKRISANFSKSDSTMIRCSECGSMVQGGSNTMFCPYCGKNFKTLCPQCGTTQQTNNSICIKCGFNFKEGEAKAQNLSLTFRMDIQKGNLHKAEKDLTQLKSIYSTFAGLSAMEMQLRKEQGTVNTLRKMLSDAYGHNRYYTAKTAGDQIALQYPQELEYDPETKQKYSEATEHVQNADVFCKKAQEITERDGMLALYVSAIEECPDHPDARGVLKQHPPQGPVDPSGKIAGGHLQINFEAPVDNKGITYVIYREKNSLPTVTDDTRPLSEIPNCEFTDKTLEPGVEYYYSVYSKRWGILSREAAHFGPVITLSEVEKVNIEHIDGGLRLMFNKPRGATRVRVWRADDSETNGTGVEVPIGDNTVYDDVGLKGGVKYHYLFVAEYETRNKVERSQGIIVSETPLDAPDPIRDLAVSWNKSDGTYTAKWSTKNPVILFRSDKKYTIQGNMVKMDDIRSWMTEIKPIQEYIDGARFNLPDGTVQYIYPIIPIGSLGVKGNEMMVANLKPFRDVEKVMSNKDCILTMTWPEGAVSAKLVISNSDFKDLDDPTAEIMTVKREEYNQDKLIRIPMGRALKKCINIFALYKIGSESLHSRGIAIDVYSAQCKKVRYEITKERKGTILEITTDLNILSLPPMVAVHVEEGIPLRKSDGEVVWSSAGEVHMVSGMVRLNITMKSSDDLEHIRLFFANEEDYNLYRFIHPLYKRRNRDGMERWER